MLDDYIPAYVSDHVGTFGAHTAKYALEGIIHDSSAEPRKLPHHNNLSAYSSDKHDPALSARSIVDSIDWHNLPDNHILSPELTGDGFSPTDWDIIRKYARTRGTGAHILRSTDDTSEATLKFNKEMETLLNDIDDVEYMHQIVHRWQGSTEELMSPDILDAMGDTPSNALQNACKEESRFAADNWKHAELELRFRLVLDEAQIVNTVDGTRYAAKPDRISYLNEPTNNLPSGLYNIDGKVTERIKPKHVVQAEAQRRIIDSITNSDATVHAAVLRLGTELGSWDIHSSHDDDWPAEQAWEMFQSRAETLYNDGLVQAALSKL